MARIIAITNQKGGVGKTTTSINLSTALGVLEKKVLLVDADPQANASSGLGIDVASIAHSTYQVIEHACAIEDAIIATDAVNVAILPSNIDLLAVDFELADRPEREQMLGVMLERISDRYDYILIDCAPSLGLITINALTAAHSVIIPVQCEYFALEGVGKLLQTIKSVKQMYNTGLSIEGILFTMYDARLRLSNSVVAEVKKHFEDKVFNTIISRNIRLGEAPSHGQSIIEYDVTCKGAENYLALANELITKTADD